MAEYIDKEQFLASMGLTGDETKYGNRDAEHLHRSYSTYMSYEIMDCVDDSIVEEELVPVVHGRWLWEIADNGWANWMCSKCGYTRNVDAHVVMDWNYCPYCGARMDGDANEG